MMPEHPLYPWVGPEMGLNDILREKLSHFFVEQASRRRRRLGSRH